MGKDAPNLQNHQKCVTDSFLLIANAPLACEHAYTLIEIKNSGFCWEAARAITSRESSHVFQVLVAKLSWPKDLHEQQIGDYHPRDQDKSIVYRHRVGLHSLLLAENPDRSALSFL